MIFQIILMIQVLMGAVGLVIGKLFYQDMIEGQLLVGVGAGLVVTGICLLLIRILLKSRKLRKLSDKDKRSVVGAIELKVEQRKNCMQKAGYLTFCVSHYAFAIAAIAIMAGGFDPSILRILAVIAIPQILLFGTFFIVGRLWSDD